MWNSLLSIDFDDEWTNSVLARIQQRIEMVGVFHPFFIFKHGFTISVTIFEYEFHLKDEKLCI